MRKHWRLTITFDLLVFICGMKQVCGKTSCEHGRRIAPSAAHYREKTYINIYADVWSDNINSFDKSHRFKLQSAGKPPACTGGEQLHQLLTEEKTLEINNWTDSIYCLAKAVHSLARRRTGQCLSMRACVCAWLSCPAHQTLMVGRILKLFYFQVTVIVRLWFPENGKNGTPPSWFLGGVKNPPFI